MDNVLAEGIYWAGVHFPEPAPGASLNSWVIKDQKRAVVDHEPALSLVPSNIPWPGSITSQDAA